MDFNVVLWGNRLRAVSARPYKALDKSPLPRTRRPGAAAFSRAVPLFSPLLCRLPPEAAQAMGGRGDDRRGEAAQPSPRVLPPPSLQQQAGMICCFSFLSLHCSSLIFS